jgi:hypothetical protein
LVQDKVRGRLALPAVAVGVLAVSAVAIFILLADAPAVAFWRCALGVALLLPPGLLRRERFPRGGPCTWAWPPVRRWVRTSGSGSPRSTTRAWRRASF